ncbi:DUF6629 family protein [Modestobacter muralis]|uniref:DUF6629 family protein n=1 Tax=Modestobacter muralis TaxID=1608614 RepID=UPI0030B8F721
MAPLRSGCPASRLPGGPDMCFSATASFTAGTALTAVGMVTVYRSRGRSELPLAAVPLLFGLQQLTEGLLWVGLDNDLTGLQSWSTYVFSLFSHVLWPMFIPFAFLLVEPVRWRRRAISVFLALGIGVGLYLLYFLVRFPVSAHVHERSISYDSPHFYIAGVLVIYLLATCFTGLFSSHRCVRIFGVLAFVLAIAAVLVSIMTFVSVWCFFAALLSLLILIHFSGPMQAARTDPRERATERVPS